MTPLGSVTTISPVGHEAYVKSLTAGMLQLQGIQPPALLSQPAAMQGFQSVLATAIEQTSALQRSAEAKATEFLTGQAEDLHGLIIAQEKAGLAFQLTLQVRNKVVESYQEVMRMQI